MPGDTIIPPAYTDYRWEPPEDEAFTLRPRQGRAAARRGGLQGRRRRTAHDAGRHPDRHAAAVRPARGADVDPVMDFFQEWLGETRHRLRGHRRMESNKLTNIILDGEFDIFHWGWYVEPDPDSMLSYFTCDQRGNWSDSWYCNEEYDKLYAAAERRDRRREAAARSSSRCRRSCTRTRPTSSPRTRHDRPGLPQRPVRVLRAAAEPRRHPAVPVRPRQLPHCSTGRASAGDCDGVGPASGATTTPGGRRGRRLIVVVIGGRRALVLVAGRWLACSHAPAAPRTTASEPMTIDVAGDEPEAPRTHRRPTRPRRASHWPLRRRARCWERSASLFFVLVVNFFLFRVITRRPRADAGPRPRSNTQEQLEAVPRAVRPGPDRCPSSSSST